MKIFITLALIVFDVQCTVYTIYNRECKIVKPVWQHVFIVPWEEVAGPILYRDYVPVFTIPNLTPGDVLSEINVLKSLKNIGAIFRNIFRPPEPYFNECNRCRNMGDIIKALKSMRLPFIGDRNVRKLVEKAYESYDNFFVNKTVKYSISVVDIFSAGENYILYDEINREITYFEILMNQMVRDSLASNFTHFKLRLFVLMNCFTRLMTYYNYNLKRTLLTPNKGAMLVALNKMELPVNLISVPTFSYLLEKIIQAGNDKLTLSVVKDHWSYFYSNSLCRVLIAENLLFLYVQIPLTRPIVERHRIKEILFINDEELENFPVAEYVIESLNQSLMWLILLFLVAVLCKRKIIPTIIYGVTVIRDLPIVEAQNVTSNNLHIVPSYTFITSGTILGLAIVFFMMIICCTNNAAYLTTHRGRVKKNLGNRGILNNYVLRYGIYVQKTKMLENHEMEIYIEFPLETNSELPLAAKYIRLHANMHLWIIVERGPSLRLECLSPVEFDACRSDGQVVAVMRHFVSIPLNTIEWHRNSPPDAFKLNDYGVGIIELIGRMPKEQSSFDDAVGHTFMKTSIV